MTSSAIKIKSKTELGIAENKSITIEAIQEIEIKKFRSFEGRRIALGSNVTVLVGRNGTMKTSLLGLIAHPFSSESKDAFGGMLKTSLSEVFKLSSRYDAKPYAYDLVLKVHGNPGLVREEVKIYYVGKRTQRHRIVVSGGEKGDGNFIYNTSFLNLKRLLPLVDTNAKPDSTSGIKLSAEERAQQKDFYESIFPSTDYGAFEPIRDEKNKTTFAPTGSDARYDYEAISSGEDNLGAIFNRLLGFQRAFTKGQRGGNGIFCIDEFESGLHPVAQVQLFDYLNRWASKYKVQIVITTHSLHLIQNLYLSHSANLEAARIVINFVSCSGAGENRNYPILQNPDYDLAYQELTLEAPQDVAKAKKIKVLCEDDLAIHFVRRLVRSSKILDLVEFHSNLDRHSSNNGTPYASLAKLCKSFPLLLEHALVIFDGDVGDTITKGIKEKDTFLVLPDFEGLALERRIVCFICDLKNDDPFFKKFKKERDRFLLSFKKSGINSLGREDLRNEQKTSIDGFKKWATDHSQEFKKYVTHYVTTVENERTKFAEEFLQRINRINEKRGLPLVSL